MIVNGKYELQVNPSSGYAHNLNGEYKFVRNACEFMAQDKRIIKNKIEALTGRLSTYKAVHAKPEEKARIPQVESELSEAKSVMHQLEALINQQMIADIAAKRNAPRPKPYWEQ